MHHFAKAIAQILQNYYPGTEIQSLRPVGGGCICSAAEIKTSQGSYFIKYKSGKQYSELFNAEKRGLELLAQAGSGLIVPAPLCDGVTDDGISFLLMEYIEAGQTEKDFWKNFALHLAQLHANSAPHFGLDFDNFMGSLPQSNSFHEKWTDFFVRERLEPQVRMALDNGRISTRLASDIAKLSTRLSDLVPIEKPSFIHGDLWSGNFMAGPGGKVVIFDPACYYGHRESDMAMTHLFGGFSGQFYEHYNEFFPLETGWRQRLDLYNVYPLLIHVNLFGGSYAMQLADIVLRFA